MIFMVSSTTTTKSDFHIKHTVYQFRGYAQFQRQQYFEKYFHAANSIPCSVWISWSVFQVQLAPNTVNEKAIEDFVN